MKKIIVSLAILFAFGGLNNAQAEVKEVKKVPADAKMTIVKFYLPTCPHCQMIKKPYEDLANKADLEDIEFLAVDTSDGIGNNTANKFGIYGVPTFIVFDKTGKKKKFAGASKLKQVEQEAEKIK